MRKENLRADSYNLVGFQNHLKFGEQARVLRLIPGLENARFLRYGQIHRNTYIQAPLLLDETLRLKTRPSILVCRPDLRSGGVYGVHCHGNAGGNLCGGDRCAVKSLCPPTRARRSARWFTTLRTPTRRIFQPANITFDLLEPLEEEMRKKIRDKKERHTDSVRTGAGGV